MSIQFVCWHYIQIIYGLALGITFTATMIFRLMLIQIYGQMESIVLSSIVMPGLHSMIHWDYLVLLLIHFLFIKQV